MKVNGVILSQLTMLARANDMLCETLQAHKMCVHCPFYDANKNCTMDKVVDDKLTADIISADYSTVAEEG